MTAEQQAAAAEQRFASEVFAATELASAREFKRAQEQWRAEQLASVAAGARLEKARAKTRAEAEKNRLEDESKPYRESPALYRQWRYLVSFRKTVGPARKYIIAVGPGTEVEVNLDLQESLQQEMYQVKPK